MIALASFLTGLALAVSAFFSFSEPQLGALSIFKSIQVGSSPTNGDFLTTNGTDSTWTDCTTLLGAGLCDGTDDGGGGSGVGTVATSSLETRGQLSYWTSTSGYPARLGGVATTSLTATSPLALSQPISVIGSSASALSIDTSGAWTGNAGTASALAANGADCSGGYYPLGVSAAGVSADCTLAVATTSAHTWDLAQTFTAGFDANATSTATALILDTTAGVSASESVGGVLRINRGTAVGPALVAYTNAGANGGRLGSFVCDNTAHDTQCLHVRSDSELESTFNVLGSPQGKGIVKIGSNGAGDADASGLSIDTSLLGFLGQGIFLKGNSSAKLLNIRNADSTEVLTLLPSGRLGIHSSAPTAAFQVGGAFMVATNTASTTISGALTLPFLTSALVLAGSDGAISEYAGIDCTNQFVRDVSAAGAGTCATVGTADVSGLDISADTNLAVLSPITLTDDTLDLATTTDSLFPVTVPGYVLGWNGTNYVPMATSTCEAITGSADLCDGDDATGVGGGTFPFTPTTNFGAVANATGTPIWFQAGLQASSTSYMATTTFEHRFSVATTSFTSHSLQNSYPIQTHIQSVAPTETNWYSFNVSAANGEPAFSVYDYCNNGDCSPGTDIWGVAAIYSTSFPYLSIQTRDTTNTNHASVDLYGAAANAGDTFATMQFYNTVGDVFSPAAQIIGVRDVGPTDVAKRGKLSFLTSPATSPIERMVIGQFGAVGIGTSTPYHRLTVSSSTQPQLSLTDGSATKNPWTFRSINSNFYLATSSTSGNYATSTTAAIHIDHNGVVNFGSRQQTCIALTGHADLCDGGDATGVGGGDFPFTLNAWGNSTTTTIGFLTGGIVVNAASSTFTGGTGLATTTFQQGVQVTATGNTSASNSVGGMVNLTNTLNAGPALVVYTNNGASTGNLANFRCDNTAQAHDCVKIDHDGAGDGLAIAATASASNALSVSNSGLDHTFTSAYTGSTANKGAMNLTSTNTAGSVFQIAGNPIALGVGKITHNSTGDADSSILSLAASDAGYLGQGVFLDMGAAATQKILNLRANGVEKLTFTSMGLGLGSTTPWAMLSIASSTYNYKQPLFVVATSTDSFGSLFTIFATSTTLLASSSDSGVRIGIGTNTQYNAPIRDQVFVPGRISTGDWGSAFCETNQAAASVTTATGAVCGSYAFGVDSQAQYSMNIQTGASGVPYFRLDAGDTSRAQALAGAALYLPITSGTNMAMNFATNTPVFEAAARINTPGNATSSRYYLGFLNINTAGTTYEVEPTAGCYFVASSTLANWQAECRTASGAATITTVDTGIASTSSPTATGHFYRFRIEAQAGRATFLMQTQATTTMYIVATITTNVPPTSGTRPTILLTAINAGLSKKLDVAYVRSWWRMPWPMQ